MHLTLNIEDEVTVLDKYNLTPNELFIARLILLYQDGDESDSLLRYSALLKRNDSSFRDNLLQLQKKNIILKSFTIPLQGQAFNPNDVPFNKNFIKNLYRSCYEMGKELFDSYPQFGFIGGNAIPLRGISKKFDSLEQAFFRYAKSINNNSERHEQIIELVNWAKEHNVINCALSTFIVDQKWNDLEALRDGDTGINYDNIKLL